MLSSLGNMFYSTLPLLVLVSLGCSASLASPIIEDFESDWTSAVSPFSSSLRRRHFNFDCNDRGKHDRITDEVGFAIEALKITQKELDLNNYYYKNFVPSKEQKNWIDDFKENIYEELINLAADEDYTLRLTCDGTTSQCKEKLGDLRTYAHTDAQTKHINICDAWFTMPKTHDLQQTCDGRTLGAYETGAFILIHEYLHLAYVDIRPKKKVWEDLAYGVDECYDAARDPKRASDLNENPDTYVLIALGTYFSKKANCDIKLGHKGA